MSKEENVKRGRRNKHRGDNFEILAAARAEVLGLSLIVKRIERIHCRGISKFDLEFIDFPELKPDCKFTEGEFTLRQKMQLLAETREKYCREGGVPLVILGEKKNKTRLNHNELLVLFYSNYGVTMAGYDNFLRTLDQIKSDSLKRR